MLGALLVVASSGVGSYSVFAQSDSSKIAAKPRASRGGATFIISNKELQQPVSVIAYGDMRFTDPSNVTATNPMVRRALIERIAEEKPDAVLLSGDVPWHGGTEGDYSAYATETLPWRDAQLRIFPALGNHEFAQCEPQRCLENWWNAFQQLKDRRWYSAQLGTKLYVVALDSNASLLPDSAQALWLQDQIAGLPKTVAFVMIVLHHPPVADIQTKYEIDHNPRANELALASLLKNAARTSSARFIVTAGHIHNYERFLQDNVVYIVSGGGGALPYPVERTAPDLYQDAGFPNYHYLKFVLVGNTLKATMYRLADPATRAWETKDTFEIPGKNKQAGY